jgi:hypothetical protein
MDICKKEELGPYGTDVVCTEPDKDGNYEMSWTCLECKKRHTLSCKIDKDKDKDKDKE